jgi:hypothetical protein
MIAFIIRMHTTKTQYLDDLDHPIRNDITKNIEENLCFQTSTRKEESISFNQEGFFFQTEQQTVQFHVITCHIAILWHSIYSSILQDRSMNIRVTGKQQASVERPQVSR